MKFEYTKAFDLITERVNEELVKTGYTRQKVASGDDKELVALFTSQNIAYSVVYIKDRQQMVLRTCTMTEDGPDNEWKTLSTWLYDDLVATQKDAESIANDFAEGVSGAIAVKRSKQIKQKKKKGEDGTADPKFLAKRFVTFFPELKDEIRDEEDCYDPFRGATFAKEHIAPKVAAYLKTSNAKETEKLAALFNLQYGNGDVDTRAVITAVIINALEDNDFDKLCAYFNDELTLAGKSVRKYRGKEVKPEKVKVKTPSKYSTLRDTQG